MIFISQYSFVTVIAGNYYWNCKRRNYNFCCYSRFYCLSAQQPSLLRKRLQIPTMELKYTQCHSAGHPDQQHQRTSGGTGKAKIQPEDIIEWISRFKYGDPNNKEYRRQIIDIFLNSIYVFDDKLVFTYNYKNGMQTVTLADVLRLSVRFGVLYSTKTDSADYSALSVLYKSKDDGHNSF